MKNYRRNNKGVNYVEIILVISLLMVLIAKRTEKIKNRGDLT